MTTFQPHPNNVTSTLASAYTAGSGSLVLAAGTGASFGSVFPLRVTVATAASYGQPGEVNTIFTVTGRGTDTLAVSGAIEGTTDRDYAIGDRVDVRWTDGLAKAVEAAVNGVESSSGITSGTIAAARLGSGTPSVLNWLRGDGAWAQVASFRPVSKTGAGALAAIDTFCLCDASAGAFALTLPPAAANPGVEYVLYKSDGSSNAITIQAQGTDSFDSGGTKTLTARYKFLRLMSIAPSTWVVIGSN